MCSSKGIISAECVRCTLYPGDVLSFVGYGRGADSHIFPKSDTADDVDVSEGGTAGESVAVEDAVPFVRHLPLRSMSTDAAAVDGETAKASL